MVRVWFDGSIFPVNPGGTARAGVIIENGKFSKRISQYIGKGAEMSNNVAEYAALIIALEYLLKNNLQNEKIMVYGDSLMVINQMSTKLKKYTGLYSKYAIKCWFLVERFSNIFFQWIPREQNVEADKLSNPNRESFSIVDWDTLKANKQMRLQFIDTIKDTIK